MWSVCEHFLGVKQCLSVVSTHNHLLKGVLEVYPSTRELRMGVGHRLRGEQGEEVDGEEVSELEECYFEWAFYKEFRGNKARMLEKYEHAFFSNAGHEFN